MKYYVQSGQEKMNRRGLKHSLADINTQSLIQREIVSKYVVFFKKKIFLFSKSIFQIKENLTFCCIQIPLFFLHLCCFLGFEILRKIQVGGLLLVTYLHPQKSMKAPTFCLFYIQKSVTKTQKLGIVSSIYHRFQGGVSQEKTKFNQSECDK